MELDKKLLKEIDNKLSGSAAIVNQLQNNLYVYSTGVKEVDKQSLIKALNNIFSFKGQFAALYHFINELFNWIEENYFNNDIIEAISLLTFLEKYNNKWSNTIEGINHNFKTITDFKKHQKILLHSNSSTVTDIMLKQPDKNRFQVYQTVSSPNEEGKIQAATLAKAGFNVCVFVDAMAAKIINEIDYCILGADVIFESFFINKIGSLGIAHSCQYFKKPLYVLTDSRKFISKNTNQKIQNILKQDIMKARKEIWKNYPQGIQPLNFYFESIENMLVSKFITESKVLDNNKLKRFMHHQTHSEYFN